MALKIRLRQQGRTNRRTFRLVVTDSRSPRDGKYVEDLGWYQPVETVEERLLSVKPERVQHWIDQGAEPTPKAMTLISKVAPEVAKGLTEKRLAKRAKEQAKRRARRKAKAAA